MGDSLAKWMKCPSEIRCSKAMASSAGRIPPLSGKVNNQVLIAAPPGGRCLSLETTGRWRQSRSGDFLPGERNRGAWPPRNHCLVLQSQIVIGRFRQA